MCLIIIPDDVPPPVKKVKSEPEDAKEEKLRKKQNEELFAVQDKISVLDKKELIAILEKNHQGVPSGTSNVSILYTFIIVVLQYYFSLWRRLQN